MRSNPVAYDEIGKLKALLVCAQNSAQRSRLALERLEIESINDYAYLTLASAIYAAKDGSGLTWGDLTRCLGQPCSEEMLRKCASRAKKPSNKAYRAIQSGLIDFANKRGLDLPKIEDIKEFV